MLLMFVLLVSFHSSLLNSKFGPNSDLNEAINKLEEKPESQARQSLVAEEVVSSNAVSDLEINELAQTLLDLLEATTEGKAAKSKYQISVQDSQIGVIGDDTEVAGGINFNKPD